MPEPIVFRLFLYDFDDKSIYFCLQSIKCVDSFKGTVILTPHYNTSGMTTALWTNVTAAYGQSVSEEV